MKRKRSWYHLDHLNSTKMVTDANGEIEVNYIYRAFGEQLKRLDSLGADTDDSAKYSYGGKELDDVTNLYYFNARYYDATIGRFINVDPVQDGTNWYVYCSNNPLNAVDPTGLIEASKLKNPGNSERNVITFSTFIAPKIQELQEIHDLVSAIDHRNVQALPSINYSGLIDSLMNLTIGNIPGVGGLMGSLHTMLSGGRSVIDNRTWKNAEDMRTMLDPFLLGEKDYDKVNSGQIFSHITLDVTLTESLARTGTGLLDFLPFQHMKMRVTYSFFEQSRNENGEIDIHHLETKVYFLETTWNWSEEQMERNPIIDFFMSKVDNVHNFEYKRYRREGLSAVEKERNLQSQEAD